MVPFANSRSTAFFWLIAASIVLIVIMNWVGAPLNTPAAPAGIISFELARTPADSSAMLSSWDAAARQRAAFSLGIDYLFMLVYAGAIGLAAVKAGAVLFRYGWPLHAWGNVVGWGAWLAALLDAAENIALTLILFTGEARSPWPQIAAICAAIKFGLIFIALVYIFYALAAAFAARLSPGKQQISQ